MTISFAQRLAVLTLHSDPERGSPYWIELFRARGLTAEAVAQDPALAGGMDAEALRHRPLEDFVPRSILDSGLPLVTGETGGFTGDPIVTAYLEEEFTAGFVTPFIKRAAEIGFPVRCNWLWAGPSGPHIIGKAVRAILREVNGLDPFAVDFDPRWFNKLPEESLSRKRYLEHLHGQILRILERQRIDVLFTTPPVVRMLGEILPESKRLAIRGVHYGGIAIPAAEYDFFLKAFPNAIHLSGYGNSLFGMFPEEARSAAGIEYRTEGSARVEVAILRDPADLRSFAAPGQDGRILMSRYDRSFLILNLLERDIATRTERGILDPRPEARFASQKVIY